MLKVSQSTGRHDGMCVRVAGSCVTGLSPNYASRSFSTDHLVDLTMFR